MINLTLSLEKRIEQLVTANYNRHDAWDNSQIPETVKKVQGVFAGNRELYDESLMSSLNISYAIKEKRVLEFGAGGMSSSFDMVAKGAKLVYVMEYRPFGLVLWKPEELDELLMMKAECKAVDRNRVVVETKYVGGSDRNILSQRFEQAYFFFPDASLVGTFPEDGDNKRRRGVFAEIVKFAYINLVEGGCFTIVTEVNIPYINEVLIDGFKRTFERRSGSLLYTEEQRVNHDNSYERIRPASSLALTVLKYEKVSEEFVTSLVLNPVE